MTYRILLLLAAATALAQDYDVIIRGGRIVDGMGNAWYRADVAVKDGRIAAIGTLADRRTARRTIDAQGMVVAPGFIDMMAATSLPLLVDSESAGSKLRQGITTMLAGEGNSVAPQNDRTFAEMNLPAGLRWRTFAEYLKLLRAKGIRLNVVHNVGAAQVRRVVMGVENREPTPQEMEAMKAHVEEAMRAGAVGVSTALIYPPGTYATTGELVELCKVAARYGGFYSTHMRNESSKLIEAISESLEIGEKAGLPVHIYHLKAAGEDNWPLMARAIGMIAEARSRGRDVTADTYPYIRNGLNLGSFIHPRHYSAGAPALHSKLASPGFRTELRAEIESDTTWENWYRHVGRNWDNVLVASFKKAEDKKYEGKSVAQIASLQGKDPWTAFFDLVVASDPSVNPKSMNEDQKHQAMRAEWLSFDTDAEPINIAKATSTHPRAFGAFPRVLARYVREARVITLEAAIRKMTSLPANRLKLFDRGRLAPGMAADIVIFDPDRVEDLATFEKPLAFPKGIPYVLVNGHVAVDNDSMTAEMGGRTL
ncbi:MAG: D-aminoacylase [Acidobacteria bacterium]|nr:D-aminoacylase [Acidobacteriota bacterium]